MRTHRSLIDISAPLRPELPIWPESSGFSRQTTRIGVGAGTVTVSEIQMDLHTGTHVDAPLHFIADGPPMSGVPLDAMIGRATVVELDSRPAVTASMLAAAGVALGCTRILLKTRNSSLWNAGEFRQEYQALTAPAARWLVARGVALVGIDYLSIQRFDDGPEVHTILLEAGVVIVEGLVLDGIAPGEYELICAPLSIPDAEAAPARAFVRALE